MKNLLSLHKRKSMKKLINSVFFNSVVQLYGDGFLYFGR